LLVVGFVCALISSAAAVDSARAGGVPCAAGSSSVNGIEPCTPCEAGTFAPNPGAFTCVPCAIGQAAPSTGSTSCAACDPGTYADQPGTIACLPCAPGTAVEFAGAPSCLACPPGYQAEDFGQTTCQICSAGSFASEPGTVRCESCPAGSYSFLLGALACTPCAPGTYSAEVGAISEAVCTACSAGSYANAAGAAACQPCPRNAYQPSTGAASCLACGCDDGVACTRDACNATSGACSAPAVPACQEQAIEFIGSVTYIDERLFSEVTVGEPFSGTVRYDPEAPDHTPMDAIYGDYESALTYLSVQIGDGPQLLVESTTGQGSVTVQNDGINGDILWFELRDEDGLLGPTFPAVPDALPSTFLFGLREPNGTALSSDALPATPPSFAPFTQRSALLEMASGTLGNLYVESTDLTSVPEADAAFGGAVALGAIVALRRRRPR